MRLKSRVSVIVIHLLLLELIEAIKIQVCHNKHCSKSGGGAKLLRTFANLGYDIMKLERSGCLSECGKGPNISVGSIQKVYNGVGDVHTAAAILEVAVDEPPPPILVAACSVMDRADKTADMAARLKLLTSVVKALENEKESITIEQKAAALAWAYTLRSEVYLDQNNLTACLNDCNQAVGLDRYSKKQNAKIWRIRAEACELVDDVPGALAALNEWASIEPGFKVKAQQEAKRIASYSSSKNAGEKDF